MAKNTLFRLSGLAAVIGAVLFIVSWWIHPPNESAASILSSMWVPAHTLGAGGVAFFGLGLLGIYLKQSEKIGVLGLVGFLLSLVSYFYLFTIYSFAVVAEPVFAKHAPQLLDPTGTLYTGFLSIFFLKAIIEYVLGGVLFGFATLNGKVFNNQAGVLLIVGAVPLGLYLINPEAPFMIFQVAGTLYGLGIGWLGYSLWEKK